MQRRIESWIIRLREMTIISVEVLRRDPSACVEEPKDIYTNPVHLNCPSLVSWQLLHLRIAVCGFILWKVKSSMILYLHLSQMLPTRVHLVISATRWNTTNWWWEYIYHEEESREGAGEKNSGFCSDCNDTGANACSKHYHQRQKYLPMVIVLANNDGKICGFITTLG